MGIVVMRTARVATTLVTLMLLVSACGSTDPKISQEPPTASTPIEATPLAVNTPTTTTTPTPTPTTAEATPTVLLGASVSVLAVAISDMRELTWASSEIVHGTVAEKLPSERFPAVDGPLGTMTPQNYYDLQIYTDYVIDVDQVFRGAPTKTVTLREQGGQVDGVVLDATAQYPELHVGDDLVLFLVHGYPEKSGDALWATGVSQGIWLPNGDKYAPYHGQFAPTDLTEIGHAVADALQQGPPEGLPLDLVPLDQSPPGPDLPQS